MFLKELIMLDKILEMQIRRSRETRGCISYCLLSRPYDHMLKMLLKCIEFFFNFRRKIGKRISQIINRNINIYSIQKDKIADKD